MRRQNWTTKYEIAEVVEGAETVPTEWHWLAAGITDIDPEPDDNTDTYEYYDGYGVPEEVTTSISQRFTVEGHRMNDDEAQNIIAKGELDAGKRVVWLRVTDEDGKYTGKVSVSNIKLRGGSANDARPFNCDLAWNGRPTKEANTTVGVTVPGETEGA